MAIRVVIDEEQKFAGDFDLQGVGAGGFLSLFLHASVFLMVLLVTHQKKKNDVMLTEISLVDQIIPIPEPEEPPPPAPIKPPEEKNVWDFLKKAIPVKQKAELANDLPMNLPKKEMKPEMAPMPDALKLGSKKDLDKPMLDKPLDLVGRKAMNAPAMTNVNPLQLSQRKDSLAMSNNLPSGISLGKKSSFLPSQQMPAVNASQFARRADLQARGGSLADMPAIQKRVEKKKVELDTTNLNIKRQGGAIEIFGALKGRRILHQFLPKYPRWAEEQGIESSVSIHCFVLPDGTVKDNCFVEQSSGYSEMDQLAIKALLAFKFAPLDGGEKQEEQEGIVVFHFRLSR